MFLPVKFVGIAPIISHRTLSTVVKPSSFLPIRSCFFPKKTYQGLRNAYKYKPDVVVLDLEDSIQAHEKPSMRKLYLEALRDKVFPTNTKVFIRSSSLNCHDDIKEDISTFTGSGITGFLLPKIEESESVLEFEKILARYEKERNLTQNSHTFIPILETPSAHFQAHNILSSTQRVIAVIAGSGDFTAYTVCNDHSLTYDTFFAQIALAAKATGKIALWGVHDLIDDHIGFEKFCMKMKDGSYQGAVTLTPKQITLANQIYSLLHNEKEWVDNVLKKSSDQVRVMQRSVQESRQMIGPPHRLKAQNITDTRSHQTAIQSTLPAIKGTSSLKGICPGLTIGQIMNASHEACITESWKTAWECSFISSGGYNNKYSQVFELPSNRMPLPFTLTSTMAVAFSVANLSYYARVHLGFKNIFQHRPLLTGDRVRAMFRIDSVSSKKGSDGNQYSVLHSTHWLINQNDEVTTQLEKITMFQPEDCQLKLTENKKTKSFTPNDSLLRKSILESSSEYFLPSTSQQDLIPGTLLVHDLVKVMGQSETRMLCNLLHIVNPHHHNKVRYRFSDLLVPGPFIMSAGMSVANQDIGEVVYEDVPVCINPNKVNFNDQLGAMTFIVSNRPFERIPEYEEVIMKHFIIKNTDMEVMTQVPIPLKLFENGHMKPSQYEELCASECPVLLHKIACVVTRRVVRVRPGYTKPHSVPCELYVNQL